MQEINLSLKSVWQALKIWNDDIDHWEKRNRGNTNTENRRREMLLFYIHFGGMLGDLKIIWDQILQVLTLQECVRISTWEQFIQQILNHNYSEVFEITCIYVDVYFSSMDLVVWINLCFIFFLKVWVKAPVSLSILLHFQTCEVGQIVLVIPNC